VIVTRPPSLLATLPLPDCPRGLFLHDDQLVVILSQGGTCEWECTLGASCRDLTDRGPTRTLLYDLEDPTRPKPIRELLFSGSLMAIRRVGSPIVAVVREAAPELPMRPALEVGNTGFAGCWTPEREPAARAHADRLKAAWIADLPNP
jgi:hypothetical protein